MLLLRDTDYRQRYLKWNVTPLIWTGSIFPFFAALCPLPSALDLMPCLPSRLRREGNIILVRSCHPGNMAIFFVLQLFYSFLHVIILIHRPIQYRDNNWINQLINRLDIFWEKNTFLYCGHCLIRGPNYTWGGQNIFVAQNFVQMLKM